MPNRIIKESICTSESVEQLTPFEETLFYRLIVKCDDFGRYYADARILKGNLFPLKTLTNKQLEAAVSSLASAGIVEVYNVDGRAYLHLFAWDNHQTARAKSSKFPPPYAQTQADESICKQVQADASGCMQMQAIVPVNENENVCENENGIACAQAPTSTPSLQKYGEFSKVLLSEQQHVKLCERLGDVCVQTYIERLDGWLAEGNRKKDHYATVLNWWRRDGSPIVRSSPPPVQTPVFRQREVTEEMTAEDLF